MLAYFVALPDEAKVLITAAVMAGVAFVIQWIIKAVPWLAFLEAYAQEWGLMLSLVFINAIENYLPTGYEDASVKGVMFLLALLSLLPKFAKARGVKSFQK